MTEVTVIGSGVIGLTIAYFLKLNEGNANPYDITIVAREIPKRQYEQGDDWVNGEWSSPW
jgi:glycine/D-amino acid oxidase-like deaminating enzyme